MAHFIIILLLFFSAVVGWGLLLFTSVRWCSIYKKEIAMIEEIKTDILVVKKEINQLK